MEHQERRVLICTPAGRDAELLANVLEANAISHHVCRSMAALAREISSGAGAAIVSIEALSHDVDFLLAALRRQGPWSDFPLIVLTHGQAANGSEDEILSRLGNVVIVDRPMRIRTLMTSVGAALAARARQYEVREQVLNQRRQAEALAESERRYRLLADLAPDPIYVVQDGVIRYLNRAVESCLGMSRGELQGIHPTEFTLHDHSDHEGDHLPGPAREQTWLKADGTHVEMEVATSEIVWANRPAVQVVARDITARKRAEEALLAASQAKDDFLALVSHELRTPLTVIRGVAAALGRESVGSETERAEALDLLTQNSERLSMLVENMLRLARAIGSSDVPTEPVLVRDIIHEAVSRHLGRFPDRPVKVMTENAIMEANPDSMDQVLENFLSNAEKYSAAHTTIEVLSYSDGRSVTIRVLDEGEGLADDEIDRCFEPFFRSQRRVQDQKPGAGLGLTVCKTLVEAQGGTIWARSRNGRGSEFGFTMPALQDE